MCPAHQTFLYNGHTIKCAPQTFQCNRIFISPNRSSIQVNQFQFPWRWRQYVSLKRHQTPSPLHGVKPQNTTIKWTSSSCENLRNFRRCAYTVCLSVGLSFVWNISSDKTGRCLILVVFIYRKRTPFLFSNYDIKIRISTPNLGSSSGGIFHKSVRK